MLIKPPSFDVGKSHSCLLFFSTLGGTVELKIVVGSLMTPIIKFFMLWNYKIIVSLGKLGNFINLGNNFLAPYISPPSQ